MYDVLLQAWRFWLFPLEDEMLLEGSLGSEGEKERGKHFYTTVSKQPR